MTLLLDPDIRDWVVLPLFVIIVVAGLLRQEVSLYLVGAKQPIPAAAQRAHCTLQQCSKIRSAAANYAFTTTAWHARKQHVIQLLRDEAEWLETEHENQKESAAASSADPMEAMFKNPMSMMGGSMVFMVQNMVMMQGIQHFFSGFILLRVPFPLTIGFKNMFQRGVADLPNLESSYVSSVSWYFLVMYGLRSFFKLVTGMPSQELKEQEMLLQQQYGLQNPPNPAGPKQDAESLAKMLNQEADNLEMFMVTHKSDLDSVEKRLLGKQRYPKKQLSVSSDADFLLGSSKKKETPSSKASKKKQ